MLLYVVTFERCVLEQRVIDVLKVDVEGAEWPFLRNVLTEDKDELNSVRQLLLEMHTPRYKHHHLTMEDSVEMVFYAKKLKSHNFTLFHHRQSNYCCRRFSRMMPFGFGIPETCCQESFFVNLSPTGSRPIL